MNTIRRYFNAFRAALRMTLRGETPPVSPHARLRVWMQEAVMLVDAAYAAADAAGLDREARQKRTLTAEGRRTNMETILAAVRFHAADEYAQLLTSLSQNSITVIYATNLNDKFLISKLFDTVEDEILRAAIGQIASHLEAIPPTPIKDEGESMNS